MQNKIILYSVFAIFMAYLESAIVVYLRLLFYPEGFQFPMVEIPIQVALIEIGREVATLIMIGAVASMAGCNFKERFSFFSFTFGLWDLFYYFWLKVFISWPQSIFDWDILFLIPAPWIAPWSAPGLVSIGLISAAIIILLRPKQFPKKIFNKTEWTLAIIAGLIILSSFFVQTKNVLNQGLPDYYPWWLFFIGYGLGWIVFIRRLFKALKQNE